MITSQPITPVIKNIIILNVMMVIFSVATQHISRIDISNYFALFSPDSTLAKPWQYITYMFMHGNAGSEYFDVNSTLYHIAGNMFGLYIFGSILERMWGSAKFLAFYLIAGVLAAVCHVMALHYEQKIIVEAISEFYLNPTWAEYNALLNKNPQIYLEAKGGGNLFALIRSQWENQPDSAEYAAEARNFLNVFLHGKEDVVTGILNGKTVGASGAVMGVLAAFAYLFPNTILLTGFVFPIKAKYFVLLYALSEVFFSWKHIAGDNVAHIAHLGGMLAGFIMIILMNKLDKKKFY